jgi:hypothetical protein
MIRLALLLCSITLTACTPQQAIRAPTPAIAVTCAPQCTASCLPAVWPRWEGDPESPETWDELPPVAAELREIAEVCDVARKSCVKCLGRLQKAGVITGAVQ